jgi:hypothetical protein
LGWIQINFWQYEQVASLLDWLAVAVAVVEVTTVAVVVVVVAEIWGFFQ